jgi:hypothetical protein
MSTADTKEPLYEMQEQGMFERALPAESNLAQPSIDELTHSIQSIDGISEMRGESPRRNVSSKRLHTSSSSSNELKPEVSRS